MVSDAQNQSRIISYQMRKNINAAKNGEPRTGLYESDHLLVASYDLGGSSFDTAHTIDLFQYQTRERVIRANAIQGLMYPELGIAMDMSIQSIASSYRSASHRNRCHMFARSPSASTMMSIGTFFRYICDNGTYIARYDDLVNGQEEATLMSLE